jgi:hypothetical protein
LLRAGGASLDSLAEKFGVGRDSIHRHWHTHVSDELKSNYLAGPAQLQELAEKAADAGGSVLDNLNAVRVVLMGQLAAMVEAGDSRGVALVAGRLTETLEKIARLSGELGAMASSVTINNIAIFESPAFLKIQGTILRALAPHPEARADVVAALRDLDAGNTQESSLKVIEHVPA